MVSYHRQLEMYRSRVLNNIEWLTNTFNANGSVIQQTYKNIFVHLLDESASQYIMMNDETWIMKGNKILRNWRSRSEGAKVSYRARHTLMPQIAERDPILKNYMKVVENTDERVEIHYIYPDE